MIEGSFDARTLAYMNVALDRVCENTPRGEQHEVRERVAQGIIRCAKCGRTTLGALIEAGERALARMPEKQKKSA
jgi:ribosomal protein L34E